MIGCRDMFQRPVLFFRYEDKIFDVFVCCAASGSNISWRQLKEILGIFLSVLKDIMSHAKTLGNAVISKPTRNSMSCLELLTKSFL